MRRFSATAIASHAVVDVTMNGEDDVSHCVSEYFGSCRAGVGPGAVAGDLAQIRRATRYRLCGVASSGSAAAIPAPRLACVPRRRLATYCLRFWRASLGRGLELGEVDGTNATSWRG